MFVIESAIAKAAEIIGIDIYIIQKKNLLFEGCAFPYCELADDAKSNSTRDLLEQKINFSDKLNEIILYNDKNTIFKLDFSFKPICFGISFTKKHINQPEALVHIYIEENVNVFITAIEMGQEVNARILQAPCAVFSIKVNRVKIETTNTSRVAIHHHQQRHLHTI